MNTLFEFLLVPYRLASPLDISLEIFAAAMGVASVYYAKKAHIWVYPTGIISTGIYIFICLTNALYGDFIINLYYTSLSLFGWFWWSRKSNGAPPQITSSNMIHWIQTILIFTLSSLLVIVIYKYTNRFDRLTDYFDTFTTGIFFAAMWLMALKKIEHWLLWIAGNVISIPLYLMKGLGFTSLQFSIFLVLSIMGYFEWKKSLNKKTTLA